MKLRHAPSRRQHGIESAPDFDTLAAEMNDSLDVLGIERPAPALMKYYLLACLMTGPLFPILIIPAYFRYHTLRYRFDREGISMRWGILFRREINLTYTRIQDIHLTSNIVERWLGLARIQVQTASGSSSAEMTIEGLHEYERVRDFLYARMRGHAGTAPEPGDGQPPSVDVPVLLHEAAAALREAVDILKARRGAP